jgi:hypothetical protein
MKTLDLTKPIQTQDGRSVRIICTDKKGMLPIVALVDIGPRESVRQYDNAGRLHGVIYRTPQDLVNVPEKHKIWGILFYDKKAKYFWSGTYTTEEQRDRVYVSLSEYVVRKFEHEVEIP